MAVHCVRWSAQDGDGTGCSEQFREIRDVFNLPWDAVLHSTRHTFCTRLGESGADAFTIQKLAGHSSIVISQRYVHPTPARLERAIDMLEASTKFIYSVTGCKM